MNIEQISKKLSVPTEDLLKKETGVYWGEWTFYALVYGIRAMYNAYKGGEITGEKFKGLAGPVVERLMSREAVEFDTRYWNGAVDEDLADTSRHHLATVSLRCWGLQMYSEVTRERGEEYKQYLKALNDRYVDNDYNMLMVGLSMPLFVPDNMIGLAVLDNTEYSETAARVLAKANFDYTNLLPDTIGGSLQYTSGAYNALTCYYLSLFRDTTNARKLWDTIYIKLHTRVFLCIDGIKEIDGEQPMVWIDKEGGPVLKGVGVIATAFSVGLAKKFGPEKFYKNISRSGSVVEVLLKVVRMADGTIVGPMILAALKRERSEGE